jgi:SWI/SNF-related matrix-associated actin-dependent regulator of chromatin subfamily A3
LKAGLDTRHLSTKSQAPTCENCSSQLSNLCSNYGHRSEFLHLLDSTMSQNPGTSMEESQPLISIPLMPTKIRALVADLVKHCAEEKRFLIMSLTIIPTFLIFLSVVFSYWTYSLDLIEAMLDDCRISYPRIDGKTPFRKRTEAMRLFQDNYCSRAIIVSITCGGAGCVLVLVGIPYSD